MDGVLLSVRDIWKSFGDLPVLRGVELSVNRREVLALLGRSGSGKSTLLRCIAHLELVDAGLIAVGGELLGYQLDGEHLTPIKERSMAARRRAVGVVFQNFHLFPHMTVLGNVSFAPVATKLLSRSEAERVARELLVRVGLEDKIHGYPAQLSGGQQQRVAIARALAMRPQLMLFDEPTSALDPELVRDVLDVIRALADDGMTMLVVTHELGFAREVADTIAFMDRGRIVEIAGSEQFFAEPQSQAAQLYLSQHLQAAQPPVPTLSSNMTLV
jgi:ABC-type polar amino acid transport system ATPase subunit